MQYSIGDLVQFTYPAVHQQGTRAHDRNPKVLILHNNWNNCVHGLNFNYLTVDEINTLRMVMDPYLEMRYRKQLSSKNPKAFMELEKIITTSGNPVIFHSPQTFYARVVRPFITIRGYDPYRLYTPHKMTNIKVLQRAAHMTGKDVPDEEVKKLLGSTILQKAADYLTNAKIPPGKEVDYVMQKLQSGEYDYSPQEVAMLKKYLSGRRNVMSWFREKVQSMQGPQTPQLPRSGPGSKPGSSRGRR